MSGTILHNGGELSGQFGSLFGTVGQCQDSIQGCLAAYNGLQDVSTGQASSAANEFGNHVAGLQNSMQETNHAVTSAAQSHHGEVTDIDGAFASIVG